MEFVIAFAVAVVVVIVMVRAMRRPRPPAEEVQLAGPSAAAEPTLSAAGVNPVPVVVDPLAAPNLKASRRPDPTPRAAKPRRTHIAYGAVAHFPDLPTKPARCVGMGQYLSEAQRQRLNPGFVIAIPEPDNKHDPQAIIIADPAGRKLGYLSAGHATSYAPLIQAVGALRLDCHMDGMKLWMDLPILPALRDRVVHLTD